MTPKMDKPETLAMEPIDGTGQWSPEFRERVEAFLGDVKKRDGHINALSERAAALLAELQPPVDPLELEIERILNSGNEMTAFEIAEGLREKFPAITELAKEADNG